MIPALFAITGRIQWQIRFQQQVQILKLITGALKQLPGVAYKCTVTKLQPVSWEAACPLANHGCRRAA